MPSLSSFRDCHAGEAILVCGCGSSLNQLDHPERFLTIGVNDIGRKFQPDYLVVVNPRSQFKGDRFRYVETSQAKHLFTHLDLGVTHPGIVRFRLGQYAGTDLSDPETLHYTRNSPYVAVCLAAQMGVRRIGLLGVDFTDHHFFGATGRHPLAGSLERIDEEYKRLRAALAMRGIELVNLSRQSRLTALPTQELSAFSEGQPSPASQGQAPVSIDRKVFFVHYRFLSCGDVFRKGLMHAAQDLHLQAAEAYWDDPALADKVGQFNPDLLFVVHGRRFSRKWNGLSKRFPSAVWLLDEPYEVDDTCEFSRAFQWTFVNDPGTLSRHTNAHYLPTCFDPCEHFESPTPRPFRVGFIGGTNPRRENCLSALAGRGLLDYVVGGPWQNPALKRLCRSSNIPEDQAANLYRQSKIVVNIFRQQHHYNRQNIPATSLNPRIYEASACGALVVTEPRPEMETVCPQMPVFHDESELGELVARFAGDETRRNELQRQCAASLSHHTYADRLRRVLTTCDLLPLAPKLQGPVSPALASPMTITAPGLSEISSTRAAETVSRPQSVRQAPRRPPPITPLPFTAMPRRNLIYHIWPVRDSLWRWNVEQLIQRIDIFNGRRIVGIVHDAKSDPPEAVMQLLGGHGCEFIVKPNSPLGEATTFPEMLARVASEEENEITFYGHAKGVKYGRQAPPPVRQWAEALYATALDDWLSVWDHLQRFAMTGPFKMRGRFRSHRECSDWHYSGTFFWLRHAHTFKRAWQNVPQFYCGVEAWPGTLFKDAETACLFQDGLTRLPYDTNFWRSIGNRAIADWSAKRQFVPVPSDLAEPLLPAMDKGPRLEQLPAEFNWLISQLLSAGASRVLSIGDRHGGAAWWLARAFHNATRPLVLTVLESAPSHQLRASIADAAQCFGAQINLVEAHSRTPNISSRLSLPYDALFSDGDRGYAQVLADWELARAVGAKLIAFHDIVDSNWHVQCRCCVSRLWDELKLKFPSAQIAGTVWGGIGTVLL